MSHRWALFAARLNPSCRDAMRLLSRSLDQNPSRADRLIIAIHLLHCPACRRARRQVFALVLTLRRLSRKPASEAIPGLPREARERIIRTLREE